MGAEHPCAKKRILCLSPHSRSSPCISLEHVKEEQLAQAKKEPEKTKTISAMASVKALLSLPSTALHCAEGTLRIHIPHSHI